MTRPYRLSVQAYQEKLQKNFLKKLRMEQLFNRIAETVKSKKTKEKDDIPIVFLDSIRSSIFGDKYIRRRENQSKEVQYIDFFGWVGYWRNESLLGERRSTHHCGHWQERQLNSPPQKKKYSMPGANVLLPVKKGIVWPLGIAPTLLFANLRNRIMRYRRRCKKYAWSYTSGWMTRPSSRRTVFRWWIS